MGEPRIGHLLGAVLHDLHSPLNAAQMHLQRFMMQPKQRRRQRLDPLATDALDSALRSINRVNRLCQDGDRLAALLCGETVHLRPEPCSLLEVLHNIRVEAPALLERLDWSAFYDLSLLADPLCLYRVLVNLLSNARKYGGRNVRVLGRVLEAEKMETLPGCLLAWQPDYVSVIQVCDDGAGIPAEHRTDLFRPFGRLPLHPEPAGLGLGLWLARELVRAHGGELWLSPEDGATTFCSLWPLRGARLPTLLPRKNSELDRTKPLPRAIEIPVGTSLARSERLILLATLRQCQGNRRAAAESLGIPRRTFYNKLRQYGL